jgi:lipid-binding SYLF domain-containing protein
MKTIMLGLTLLGFAGTALGLDQIELDNRIRILTGRFEALQQRSDKSIPAENLRRAKGIVLMERTKAGFLFAYQGGSGVAMVKDEKSDKWSAPAFLNANEASLGFQIGGQQSFVVILFMTTNSTRLLVESNLQFGGEARGTAGESSSGVEGKVAPQEPSVLIYDDRRGLYGGAAIKGDAIAPDNTANRIYYGKELAMSEILFEKKVKPTEAAAALADKIATRSKAAKE